MACCRVSGRNKVSKTSPHVAPGLTKVMRHAAFNSLTIGSVSSPVPVVVMEFTNYSTCSAIIEA